MSSLPPPVAPASPGAVAAPSLPDRPTVRRARVVRYVAGLLVLGLLIYSWSNVQGSVTGLVNGFFAKKGLLRDVFPHSVPPDLSQLWPGIQAAVTTLCIAVLSIAFGIIGAIAMLPLAARNITPSRPLYEITRLVQAVLRAIPELIMLLFFLIVFGFGPWSATVVALTFHGIGVKGKLFAEAVEEMDMTPVDALRVAGAGRVQVFTARSAAGSAQHAAGADHVPPRRELPLGSDARRGRRWRHRLPDRQ